MAFSLSFLGFFISDFSLSRLPSVSPPLPVFVEKVTSTVCSARGFWFCQPAPRNREDHHRELRGPGAPLEGQVVLAGSQTEGMLLALTRFFGSLPSTSTFCWCNSVGSLQFSRSHSHYIKMLIGLVPLRIKTDSKCWGLSNNLGSGNLRLSRQLALDWPALADLVKC